MSRNWEKHIFPSKGETNKNQIGKTRGNKCKSEFARKGNRSAGRWKSCKKKRRERKKERNLKKKKKNSSLSVFRYLLGFPGWLLLFFAAAAGAEEEDCCWSWSGGVVFIWFWSCSSWSLIPWKGDDEEADAIIFWNQEKTLLFYLLDGEIYLSLIGFFFL